MILLLTVLGALAAPDAATLQARWDDQAALIRAHSPVPVHLRSGDFETLARGKAVTRRVDGAEGVYATGAIWVDAPLQAPWVVLCDSPHAPPSPATTVRLPGGGPPGYRTVYMHLDLPWPFADRHWVSDLAPNRALFDANPRVWQRTWSTGDRGRAINPDPEAVWVEQNLGAWTVVDVGEGTLVIFSVRTAMGGVIPPGMSTGVALLGLSTTMERIAALALTMEQHYDAAHEPIVAPDGSRIQPWGP